MSSRFLPIGTPRNRPSSTQPLTNTTEQATTPSLSSHPDCKIKVTLVKNESGGQNGNNSQLRVAFSQTVYAELYYDLLVKLLAIPAPEIQVVETGAPFSCTLTMEDVLITPKDGLALPEKDGVVLCTLDSEELAKDWDTTAVLWPSNMGASASPKERVVPCGNHTLKPEDFVTRLGIEPKEFANAMKGRNTVTLKAREASPEPVYIIRH